MPSPSRRRPIDASLGSRLCSSMRSSASSRVRPWSSASGLRSTTRPAPETLQSALATVGLTARLLVERRDGQPLDANDLAALSAVVQCHDLEHGRHVSDDDAARIASHAFAATPLPATGTGGE